MDLLYLTESELKKMDKDIHARKFRIIQLENKWWYLLIKRRFWFGYRPVCGRDRGANGEFNFQLEVVSNPLHFFTYMIPEITEHSLDGETAPWYWFQDHLPRLPIIKEVNVPTAWEAVRAGWKDDTQEFWNSYKKFNDVIYQDHLLAR